MEGTEEFKSGNFNFKVDVNTSSELQSLADSFNDMSETIVQQLGYLDDIPTPVMIIDREFNILYMNKKGAEINGKSKDELMGQKCFNQFKTGHCNTENCALHKAMLSGEVTSAETDAQRGPFHFHDLRHLVLTLEFPAQPRT